MQYTVTFCLDVNSQTSVYSEFICGEEEDTYTYVVYSDFLSGWKFPNVRDSTRYLRHVVYSVKRDLVQCQKRPSIVSNVRDSTRSDPIYYSPTPVRHQEHIGNRLVTDQYHISAIRYDLLLSYCGPTLGTHWEHISNTLVRYDTIYYSPTAVRHQEHIGNTLVTHQYDTIRFITLLLRSDIRNTLGTHQ